MSAAPDSRVWTPVASLADFQGQRQLVRCIGELQLLLLRVGAQVFAVRDACTHLGKSLHGGRLMGGQITCPFHGACFDVASGAAVSGPAVAPLRRYPVRIEGELVLVDVSGHAQQSLSQS
jgi:nitrite reductase/ring-hydroxylating ferredoxin subunit